MTIKNISVLGCGWLGLPLATNFIAQQIAVKGSTTTPSKIELLKHKNITPFLLTLGKTDGDVYKSFLKDSDVIIINFPPKRVPNIIEVYQKQIQSILPYISNSQKVIFISSTSVYKNTNAVILEHLDAQPEKASGKAVLAVERLLQDALGARLTILRFSGLVGYDRLPGRFLANKKELKNGDAPVNIIHRDDCIGLINAILQKHVWGEIINGCADKHPLRKIFYTEAALKIGLTPPTFLQDNATSYKIISNAKSRSMLDYEYMYPDPLLYLKA